ncbi:phenylacetate--CoA ligase family protein [Corynebacterium marinum]|uniref:Coenzyme F390 synthetase-like protein n=1 Tax=Corynebacterium marinum DSM 44953 TaxID=1224162 RepID=A0A0B6THH6_9CORY|nr:phenylacetate--CoA ligase family protein [Corynebacterium marinum]AJK69382.1 Coenzyme F390 synthetase-like protein [Corynebacterium marinum DSM 44953]GGO21933.1 capsular polysaccharide biosynthesis protein CapK [Corynebacterium marinum]
MSKLKVFYDHSPLFFQNFMVQVSGSIKAKQRYGAIYAQHRAWLKEYDTWSIERQQDYQAVLLRQFLRFASRESPFYRDFYSELDITKIREVDDLPQLPLLEKDTLRREIEKVYTVSSRKSTQAHTGGTTGKSLVVRYTREDEMRRMAMLDHFKSRHGFENRKMKRATFSGKHIVPPSSTSRAFWRHNRAANQVLYSTFHLSEENLARYVDHLNEFRPHALDGYFTPLCDIASFIERNAIKLKFKPVAIFPTAETLTERGRDLLERVFETKVYDQYASSEGAPFVTQCFEGSMHLELSTGVFETLPGTNEILVTSFQTHGTPLIRYRIGDSMDLEDSTHPCACGLATPRVSKIYGRSDDYLLRSDGAKVNSVHVASLLKYMPSSMIQAQVRQENLGEITILLVVDSKEYATTNDQMLVEKFKQSFDPSTHIAIRHVEEIPREKSGKQRLIKNTISF